jgi:predicted GNAT family acetyltransferase
MSTPTFSRSTLLRNVCWNALTTLQSEVAEGTGLARRYPTDIGPFVGIKSPTQQAWDDLKQLVLPNENVTIPLDTADLPPADWHVIQVFPLTQMVLEQPLPQASAQAFAQQATIVELGQADVADMLALTELAKPGPFRHRTYELGRYFGIRNEAGQLVAMAGERMKLDGYTEISAVCTHPDYTGRGYGSQLVTVMTEGILAERKTPFLHVLTERTSTMRLYEKLGFQATRPIWAILATPHV